MAEDKKPDQTQEDWDKLPLDPGAADDWDDIPPPATEKAPASSTSTALEKVSPAEDYFEAQSDRNKNRDSDKPYVPPLEAQPSEPPPDSAAESPADDPEPEDDFDAPDEPAEGSSDSAAADSGAAGDAAADEETPGDIAVPPPGEDDFDEEPDSASSPPPEDEAPGAADDEEIPMPNISEPKPPTKKVELDIEGMQFKEDEPPPQAAETPEKPAPEKEPAKEAPKEQPEAAQESKPGLKRKIPRLKLLLIVVPALLLVGGLVFGLLALLSNPEPKTVPLPPPVFSPNLPPRDAAPSEMRLESFYISFPGRANDTIIELSLVLHYNDSPDETLIRGKMTALRDIIYRVAQGKGSLVITDSELQKNLREELRERANLLLGGEYISYVQIDQIRILQ